MILPMPAIMVPMSRFHAWWESLLVRYEDYLTKGVLTRLRIHAHQLDERAQELRTIVDRFLD